MADLTRAEMADRALEAIGAKAAGQSASAEDANRAMEAYDVVYYSLRKDQMAPFSLSAVPEWAQGPIINLVGRELAATFGIAGTRLALILELADQGYLSLARQMSGPRMAVVRTDYF